VVLFCFLVLFSWSFYNTSSYERVSNFNLKNRLSYIIMKVCNYYITLHSNDTCEFSTLWHDDRFKNIEAKPYDLSLLKKVGVKYLNITGGEPLLREEIGEILKSAKELDFHTSLTTNGILYSERANNLKGLVDRKKELMAKTDQIVKSTQLIKQLFFSEKFKS